LVLASAGVASLDVQASAGAAGGLYTTVLLLPDNTIWTAGENTVGTIGVTPVVGSGRVRHNALTGVVSIGHGLLHAVAVTSTGAVYAWGSNNKSVFGASSPASSNVPVLMTAWPSAVAIAAGREQTYVLDASGGVWAVGENSEGELGDGSFTDRSSPVQVSGLTSGVVAISAGSQHAVALMSNGDVYAWGRGNEGQLGDGLRTTSNVPVQVTGLSAAAIAAGGFHNLALTGGGAVYAWGSNANGQIGDNTNFRRNSPVSVTTLGSTIAGIAAGHTHSLAVTTSNAVLGWGANGTYQLGLGHTTDKLVPTAIPGLTGIVAVGAGTGSHSSFAFASNGAVYGWGDNEFGRLGDGIYQTDRQEPLDLAIAGGTWRAPNPDFSRWTPGSGNIVVTNVLSTPGLTMTYTTNGVDPTLSDPIVLSGNTISVTTPTTLKVRTFLTGTPDSGVSKAVY
jgi:alpha-tubulin suppressor-like RCC1 family protein